MFKFVFFFRFMSEVETFSGLICLILVFTSVFAICDNIILTAVVRKNPVFIMANIILNSFSDRLVRLDFISICLFRATDDLFHNWKYDRKKV